MGFTLTETLVGVAVFAIIATGIYQVYLRVSQGVQLVRLKNVATALANDQIELIRNLPYQDVGIVGGFPAGKIPRDQDIARGGTTFHITTTVRSIDDPFDGTIGGTPNDTAPADYKLTELTITCPSCRNFAALRFVTTVAPKNLEVSSGGGALFIRVLDANGRGVPQANVRIENKKLTPNLVINELTNNDGILQLVDVPQSVGGYNASTTKTGYSSDQTYPPGGSDNPNPVTTDSTVLQGEVTQLTLAIDRVSTINLSTTNQLCVALPNVALRADGSKLIGTNPDKLKYSQSISTDAGGRRVLSNLEWDVYNFTVADSNYYLSGFIPFLPVNLPPNTTQDLKLLMEPRDPGSILVNVKDAGTGLAVSSTTVRIERGTFSSQAVTGRGSINQTDWSGASGQVLFSDPSRYFAQDGNIQTGSSGPGSGELRLLKVSGDYVASGWLESSTFDTGLASDFHNLIWGPTDQPPQAGPNAVRFHIAANNDAATWNFVGPDGTAGSYYDLAATDLARFNGNRYLRYRVYLQTQNSAFTPNLADIGFTFASACVPPGQVFFHGLASGTYTLSVTHPSYQTWSNNAIQVSSDFQSVEVQLSP